MTVVNGADVTADVQYTIDGGSTQTLIGWPSLEPVSAGSSTGQADIEVGPCTALGSYVFTAIRNTLNTPWVSANAPIEVTPPPAPVLTSVVPSSGEPGTAVDVTFTGSNLCNPSFVTDPTVAGITFSNIMYDSITGETASVTIHLASNTPYATAMIKLSANGGSTTFEFQVVDIPNGPPVIDSIPPEVLEHGPSQILTLTGNNLYGATFEMVALPSESGDPGRVSPTVSSYSHDLAGTWLELTMNTSDTRTAGLHVLQVWNDNGAASLKLLRVVPDGPWVDLYTPSEPATDRMYTLTLVGGHLQGAELTVADSSRMRIHNIDNSADGHLHGVLEVFANAAPGQTDLVVSDTQGREARVSITIRSDTTITRVPAESTPPKETNLTGDHFGFPPIYGQPLEEGDPLPPPVIIIPVYLDLRIVDQEDYITVLTACSSSPMDFEYDLTCLDDLHPAQSENVRGVVGAEYWVDVQGIYWSWNPDESPGAPPYIIHGGCNELTHGWDIPGHQGEIYWGSTCSGDESIVNFSSDLVLSEFDERAGCVQVEQVASPQSELYIARAQATRLCCGDETITFSAEGNAFEGQSSEYRFADRNFPIGTAKSPNDCVDTTLTIEEALEHANIVLADGSSSELEATIKPETTTLTLSLSSAPADANTTRYLRIVDDAGDISTDLGTIPSEVSLSNVKATATYTAATLPTNPSTTKVATIEVSPEMPSDFVAVDSVTVFNYSGFDFTNLGIDESDMVMPVPTMIPASVDATAEEIQRFLEIKGSFLEDFYLNTLTKEGFYDQDGDGMWDRDDDNVDSSGDILYQPNSDNNPDGSSTFQTDDPNTPEDERNFDDCTGEGADEKCGDTLLASELIAKTIVDTCHMPLSSLSCKFSPPSNTDQPVVTPVSPRSVNPRMILATMQKEQSIAALPSYPMKPDLALNRAMGCADDPAWNNFVDQIQCGAETFLTHYSASHYNNRSLEFPFFFKMSDGLRHGGIHPYITANTGGDKVAFSVMDRGTYIQYRYTNWIESEPGSGGVSLFLKIWREYSTLNWIR